MVKAIQEELHVDIGIKIKVEVVLVQKDILVQMAITVEIL